MQDPESLTIARGWCHERLDTRGHDSIASIAATVGFSDQAHFTRGFKALVGTTPARYRQSTRDASRLETADFVGRT